jgi:hypothetical protein
VALLVHNLQQEAVSSEPRAMVLALGFLKIQQHGSYFSFKLMQIFLLHNTCFNIKFFFKKKKRFK